MYGSVGDYQAIVSFFFDLVWKCLISEGSWMLEVGNGKLEMGSWKLEMRANVAAKRPHPILPRCCHPERMRGICPSSGAVIFET